MTASNPQNQRIHWADARLATCRADLPGLGEILAGSLITQGKQIVYAGATADIPATLIANVDKIIPLQGQWVTPGLIDCHTHTIFGGDRADEFALRLQGASYAELQAAGGGIFGSVNATRQSTDQQLLSSASKRLQAMARHGATTVEIKSGYGLDVKTELRMLRIANELASDNDLPNVVPTCLAAHALPAEYTQKRSNYIDLICRELLPTVAAEKLADSVDAFGENIAFTPEEVTRVFTTAQELGLRVKLHADQLSDQLGAALAAQFGALSADHLEFTNNAGVAAMSSSGTIAVLLPGAYYQLRETQQPPIEAFRAHSVPMAVATDANPGSSPLLSLPIAMNQACVQFGLTIDEAWLGVTRHAASALNLMDRGVLAAGNVADFCVWNVDQLAEVVYWLGAQPLTQLVREGKPTLGT